MVHWQGRPTWVMAIVALYMAVAGLLAELAELEWMVQLVLQQVLVLW